MIYPCKDCTDRHEGCHATCEKYLECAKKRKEMNEKMRREKENKDAIYNMRNKKFRSLGYR